ncbi:MAG TPA: hypothetical protein VE309_00015 [Caulobacteraceae bacterium]|nr:hypothetical protein [Caulobacteraceae bacterium]
MALPHVIEMDAAVALVSLIVALVGGTVGLVWLAYRLLRGWLRGEHLLKGAPGERRTVDAPPGDTQGG